MSKNFNAFLKLNLAKYKPGEYLVLVGGKVKQKGVSIERMLASVMKKYPNETPFVAKIPPRGTLVV